MIGLPLRLRVPATIESVYVIWYWGGAALAGVKVWAHLTNESCHTAFPFPT